MRIPERNTTVSVHPECASAIDSYLAYRERCYEKIGPESPLIREQFDRDNPDKARNPRHVSLTC